MTTTIKNSHNQQPEEVGQHPSSETLCITTITDNIKSESGLYCLWFNNDKFYIGRSTNIRKRILRHINELTKQKHPNQYVQRVYNKYNIKEFIIYYCTDPVKAEAKALKEYYGTANCLNLSKQTHGGYSYDKTHPNYANICKKISESNKGRSPSKESIAKAVATRKRNGYKVSEETKLKISKTSSGSNNGMYGRSHSQDSIDKMCSKKQKYKKEFHWFNLETGEDIICSVYELQKNWGGGTNGRHIVSGRIHSSQGWILV